ncbi:porin [Fimbriimonas ginsengisoli]|uniref:Phosphate-selective porin O and P superfamily n=1 Tax=Fimbriimonas ginsengisoli Gsoil 348 TaxID=661478 RepID=A0A068NX34_FIMGI|nr:porin [Fimbriimonas ginsengisoli]AIE86179.1 phosphate-selective porin O and P superfamily [Fimbriimonas ginsengisoli Gsoil 348]
MTCRLSPLVFLAIATTASAQSPTPNVKKEAERLRISAEAKAKEIGKLTAGGNLTSSDEALRLLQQAVDELKEIRMRLKALEGHSSAPDNSASAPSRVNLGGYMQFQYQDTDRKGSSQFDAFRFRRVEPSLEITDSLRLAGKITFDLATGGNQTQAQLRDAWVRYDFGGGAHLGHDRAFAGQMAIPVGYELERSPSEIELPERAEYNQILFATERSRGLKVRREGRDGMLQASVMNSLTIGDPEQANLAPGPGNRLAVTLGGRFVRGNTSVGLSGMAGDRPAYTSGGPTSPKVSRRFAFLDLEQRHLLFPRFNLHAEVMRGNDRLPTATSAATNVDHPLSGYHLLGTYQLSAMDELAARWEGFDPNLDSAGNAFHGMGLAYIRNLSRDMKLTFAHEVFIDESRTTPFHQTRYGQSTIRLQVRF